MREYSFIFLYTLSNEFEDLRDEFNKFLKEICGEHIGTTAYLFRCDSKKEQSDKIEQLEEYIQYYLNNDKYNQTEFEYSFWETNRNPIKEGYYPQ